MAPSSIGVCGRPHDTIKVNPKPTLTLVLGGPNPCTLPDDPDAPTIVKPRYLRLNERLALDFRDRVNNELIFFCDGEYRYWVGQRLKRKEGSYLLNNSGLFKYGQMRGRYQIDKETRIYAASDAVADAAKNRFKITGDIQGLLEIAEACEKSSHYIETTPTMKVAPHITVPDKHKAHATMFPELAGGGNRAAERFHAERQIAQMKQKVHAQKEADLTVEAGRRRMPQITRKYYEEVINLCNDNKQLLVVCSLGGWVKESTEMRKELEVRDLVEPLTLLPSFPSSCRVRAAHFQNPPSQVLNATLYKVYEKKNSDPKKEPPPCTGTKADGGHSMPFRLVRWDPTKDPMLRERYGVNSVPLFLFYYSKQLIGIKRRWNGYGQTKKDLIIELRAMQVNGERGRFLPADYKPAPPSLMK